MFSALDDWYGLSFVSYLLGIETRVSQLFFRLDNEFVSYLLGIETGDVQGVS